MKKINIDDFISIMIKSFLNLNNLTIGEVKITDLKKENNSVYIKISLDEGKPKNKKIKFDYYGIEYSASVELEKSDSYLKISSFYDIEKKISENEFSVDKLPIFIYSEKENKHIYGEITKVSLNYFIIEINKFHIEDVFKHDKIILSIPNLVEFKVHNKLIKINNEKIEIKSIFEKEDILEDKILEKFYYSKQNSSILDIKFII